MNKNSNKNHKASSAGVLMLYCAVHSADTGHSRFIYFHYFLKGTKKILDWSETYHLEEKINNKRSNFVYILVRCATVLPIGLATKKNQYAFWCIYGFEKNLTYWIRERAEWKQVKNRFVLLLFTFLLSSSFFRFFFTVQVVTIEKNCFFFFAFSRKEDMWVILVDSILIDRSFFSFLKNFFKSFRSAKTEKNVFQASSNIRHQKIWWKIDENDIIN